MRVWLVTRIPYHAQCPTPNGVPLVPPYTYLQGVTVSRRLYNESAAHEVGSSPRENAMSTTKPSALAMRLYELAHGLEQGHPASDWAPDALEAARVLDAELAPLVEALEGLLDARGGVLHPRRGAGKLARQALTSAKGAGEDLPQCAIAMGCLCAGHARGAPSSEPCDASEAG